MTKLNLQTPDFVAANAARLAELFPNCVTETRDPQTGAIKRVIDFDLLRQELAYDIVEGPQERYRLDWPGKREALALANAPIRKTLRPCKDESVDFDTTQNLYIEGDNLDALKLLQENYLGKVKMIYIDPPYNTGNDFIYDDNFSISRYEYQESSGAVDEEGNAMFLEEKWMQNSSASGRFHSEWLSMMYPRLKLARNLLHDDGVLFISIDDNELNSLKLLCDEIFGNDSFVECFTWHKKNSAKGKPPANMVVNIHEYILCYTKNDTAKLTGELRTSETFSNPDNDPRGLWRLSNIKSTLEKPKDKFTIIDPQTGFEFTNYWAFSELSLNQMIKEGRIVFPKNSDGLPKQKEFLDEFENPNMPTMSHLGLFHSQTTTEKGIDEMMDVKSFLYRKPLELISKVVRQGTSGKDDIVIDFFSGSATTAHAVMQLNAEDGGKRRHIMVQIPEPCDEKSEAFKSGYKTIAEIGKERIRRAGKSILEEWQAKQESSTELLKLEPENSGANPPDVGFRVLKIDSSNMADIYYQPDELTQDGLMLQVDNLKPDRKPEDLLFQVLLDWGVDLALPITKEKILKRRVFFVADNALAACFDTGLDEAFVKELAKRQPLRAVFRDSGYASDAVKINFEQIFKALSPHTELKTL
jgi:adenine-specific DNA-methyltransferase